MEENLNNAIQMHPKKDQAWQEVASSTGVSEEHKVSGNHCVTDLFVRSQVTNRSWDLLLRKERCYMESKRFLTEHISPRNTTSNFQWSDDQPCSEASVTSDNEDTREDLKLSSKTPKRQRLGNESRERLEKLCRTIESVITTKVEKPQSRNTAFLQLLDEWLQKKPEDVQDRLRIELLYYVHNAN